MDIQFFYHPISELMMSFDAFADKPSHKKIDKGVAWAKEVSSLVDGEFIMAIHRKDIKLKLTALTAFLSISPEIEKMSIQEVLDWLKDVPEEKLLVVAYEACGKEEKIEYIKQIIPLLEEWNRLYYSTVHPNIDKALKESALLGQKKIGTENPYMLIETFTNGIDIREATEIQKVVLIPQYHYAPVVLFNQFRDFTYYLYPVDVSFNENAGPSAKLLRKTRALADENRLLILQFIAEEERTFTDIKKHIKLAKSTVHHHLITLRASGLLTLVRTNEQIKYRLRQDGIAKLEEQLTSFLYKK